MLEDIDIDPFVDYHQALVHKYAIQHSNDSQIEIRRLAYKEIGNRITRELSKAAGREVLEAADLETQAPVLMDLLGVADGQIAHAMLVGVLDIMVARGVRYADAARSLFGGDGYPLTRSERFEAIAATHGITVGTVPAHQRHGLAALADEIVQLLKVRAEQPWNRSVVNAINGFRLAIDRQVAELTDKSVR